MATLQDIADRAGVSLATVSNVLSSDCTPRRSDAVRRAQHIRRVAGELGYRTNIAARAMARRRHGCMSLLFRVPHPMLAALGEGMARRLNERGMRLDLIGEGSRLQDRLATDAVVIDDTAPPVPSSLLLKRRGVPTIRFNAKQPVDSVYFDDAAGAREAVARLAAQRHSRMLLAGPPEGYHYSAAERRRGFRAGLRDAGVRGALETWLPDEEGASASALTRLARRLAAPDRPTAIVCTGRIFTEVVLLAAAYARLKVPQELAVAAFYHEPMTIGPHRLPTLVTDAAAAGASAVDLLVQRLDHDAPMPSVVLSVAWHDPDPRRVG